MEKKQEKTKAKKKELKVVVYSTKVCPYCVMAKDYLKSKKIAYEEKDVGSDRAAAEKMVEISGQMGVPVIVINDAVIVGFNRAAIDEALK